MNLDDLVNTPPWEWPKDAGKLMRKALTDRRAKPDDRLIAADLAGDLAVINDQLADALVVVVGDAGEPDELRAKAAISLGPVLEQCDLEEFDDPDELPITEETFNRIQETLHTVYADAATPKEVRRRVLEGAVRAPQDWHTEEIRKAYASGDREWMLTAVFAMRWVRGFDAQILEALKIDDAEIHQEALSAAGDNELEAAWPYVTPLLTDPATPKDLLLVAIEAAATIRPADARRNLQALADSEDEDIADAAQEAISMAETVSGLADLDEEDEDGEEGGWVN